MDWIKKVKEPLVEQIHIPSKQGVAFALDLLRKNGLRMTYATYTPGNIGTPNMLEASILVLDPHAATWLGEALYEAEK